MLRHVVRLSRGVHLRFPAQVCREFRQGLLLGLLLLAWGCDQKSESSAPAPGLATQGIAPAPTGTEADAQLEELTRELRRWIVRTKQRPGTFEEFITSARLTAPSPPPGKKYVISREMRVVLVDR
jgi:hypothetical protein